MKKTVSVLMIIASLLLSILALFKATPKESYEIKSFHKEENEEKTEIEVVDKMMYIQHYHQKLYFSGVNANPALMKFYMHELEEKMEEIANGNVWSKNVNISENMRNYGLKQLDILRNGDNSTNEKFIANFSAFTAACNGCHKASNHPEIKIKLPENFSYTNQEYKPE